MTLMDRAESAGSQTYPLAGYKGLSSVQVCSSVGELARTFELAFLDKTGNIGDDCASRITNLPLLKLLHAYFELFRLECPTDSSVL